MKYEKPMAAIEFYKLSQSIAACTLKISYINNGCVVNDDDTPVETRSAAFFEGSYFTSVCVKDVTVMDDNDTLCYHTQINALFTS